MNYVIYLCSKQKQVREKHKSHSIHVSWISLNPNFHYIEAFFHLSIVLKVLKFYNILRVARDARGIVIQKIHE